jgi:hypothetical protein
VKESLSCGLCPLVVKDGNYEAGDTCPFCTRGKLEKLMELKLCKKCFTMKNMSSEQKTCARCKKEHKDE